MKKSIAKTAAAFTAAVAMATASGCGSKNASINVISREDGSGTRSAFIELTGVEEKDADGNKVDNTTVEAMICKSTDVVLTQVAGDENAIGYISYGSLNDTVKALKVDGAEVSPSTIKDGSYSLVRPFNIITGEGVSDAAQDFISYILSAEGQAVVTDNKYVAIDENAPAYSPSGASGKVVVAGSSSVGPVMQSIAEKYMETNKDITVEIQVNDSTTGVKYTTEGVCDIGMISRDLKDDETGLTQTMIARDAIAVIVNKNNETDDISAAKLKDIYTGKITEWSEAGE